MKLLSQIAFIARVELRFFAQYPKMLLATALVVVLPALYAVIYLSSVWDPPAHTNALPVALVNLDLGVTYRDTQFNIGDEIMAHLRQRHPFGFVDYIDDQDARKAVRQGKVAFALIIPADFSSNAVPGASLGAGKLVVYTSQGNNFESAVIARHFAQTLGQDVNDSLNEQRWELVLSNAAGSQRSVQLLRDGVAELQAGARELHKGSIQTSTGAAKLATGSSQLNTSMDGFTEGFKHLGNGIRAMDSKWPSNAELNRLKNGADALAAGHVELGKGMSDLEIGTKRLRTGVQEFRDDARDSFLVPASVSDGLDKVLDGLIQLDSGQQAAGAAQQKLADGSAALSVAVGAMTSGLRTMGTSLHAATTQLPEDSALDELHHGTAAFSTGSAALAVATQRMREGAQRLVGGLDLLAAALPRAQNMDGSAQGLANSVQPEVEVTAPVANNGAGFAPNVLPAALWLGAGIAAFLIHVRVLPRHAQFFPRPAQLLGKMVLPAGVVLMQAAVLIFTVLFLLRIPVVQVAPFVLCLTVAALAFLAIVLALTRAFGDAGKALAMIFLAVQLSSSGGILPVELSGGLFASISPWLPLTWVVRALKATMFGAYEGAWLQPLLVVLSCGVAATACACWVGRWRFVRSASIRPAVDF
jgi:putative membrane protein